jgi:hypothetical protein
VLGGLDPGDETDVVVVDMEGDRRTVTVELGTKPLPNEFLEP